MYVWEPSCDEAFYARDPNGITGPSGEK
jgi:hypothetical protein